MKYRIVADSSSDLNETDGVSFVSVPLTVTIGDRTYRDDASLNVSEMLTALEHHHGRSGSACPNVNDWLEAFGDCEKIFCVTITSNLSGSFNTASIAAKTYMELHPDRCVFVLDTLSTGAESVLLIEKLKELILADHDFDTIVSRIKTYQRHTHLLFALGSLHNLANNGRVSHVVAKVTGLLGIRVIGKASENGTLELLDKVRGAEKMLASMIKYMKETGFSGGKVRIHHCENYETATKLKERLLVLDSTLDIAISRTRGLCSFYAERGGLLVGYEDTPALECQS